MEEKYDIAVIGGGPAGMMAAGKAGESGGRVVLIEKNAGLGKKLLITGKGRCNLTHLETNNKLFSMAFGKQGDFLLSGLSVFDILKTMKFFESKGLKLKQERGKRIFPQNDKSQSVLKILEKYLKEQKVEILKNAEVDKIETKDNKIQKIILENKRQIKAKNYILATGGKSYPLTGSTGSGYKWAQKMGHKIIKPEPALTPLRIKEKWIKQVQGLSLKNVSIDILFNGKLQKGLFGEALFTHFGISGPIILSMSKKIGELIKKGDVKLILDLKPALDSAKLDKRIQRDFAKYRNRMLRNALDDLLPQKLIPIIIQLSKISQNKKASSVTKKERSDLAKIIKGIKITVIGLAGFEKAIITTGGIDLKEIDGKTMKSKIIDNLYFAGEIINLDGPSGGYNLQLCWTTGYLAGQSAAKKLS